MQYYHFIAIGGAVMHQLASHLKNQGNKVTGSDDAIFEPAKSNLEKLGLLPEKEGWFPEKITKNIDAVILGMHAKSDNPELIKAQELGVKIYSFPEFVYEQCKNKTRIAVAGSHGKTSITSMIMHLLKENNKIFDYLVGAKLDGFDFMVKTSETAPLMVIEADEYLTSPLDLRSKFLHYHPQIAIISGIAWDHINVFPTLEEYLETFRKFIKSIEPNGYLIYNNDDEELVKMVNELKPNLHLIPYQPFDFKVEGEDNFLLYKDSAYPLNVFGSHNFANLKSAFEVGKILGLSEQDILQSFTSFRGAAKRLEMVKENKERKITLFRDFAHAPSKLKATVKAVRERYASRKIIAVFELHTYSSLQENFIEHYANSLDAADVKILFLDENALKIKNKQDLDAHWLIEQFADDTISVYKHVEALRDKINKELTDNCVVLLMSSGSFAGMTADEIKME
ncbi:MAG TPA: Mur ligase family protein [Chitinophagales bacterium]|jgi:UDP-N-acetylmuramate: L-alanyl-gamma-D-glutamyl-meso-diaminopimelate ligase|nr:Mur ligase family protein [Chitinophagales bacterium]HQG38004.1 Mur ligase family protein [Chitinophagales bacterium]